MHSNVIFYSFDSNCLLVKNPILKPLCLHSKTLIGMHVKAAWGRNQIECVLKIRITNPFQMAGYVFFWQGLCMIRIF
ncbi:MAG: hypothetical protein C4518_20635 [Desulfobacteraceae bacterium]|nr:MAG: hypothetical protein C4518_20635 [Desulfobacteraceae bacterium]